MNRPSIVFTIILATAALAPSSARAEDGGMVAGAAAATLPAGASLAGLTLSGLQLGTGVLTGVDDTASGAFHAVLDGTTLLGQAQKVTVEGKVDGGFLVAGSARFSGTATLDLGGGALPLAGIPFDVTLGTDSVQLTINGTSLPPATLAAGAIAIE